MAYQYERGETVEAGTRRILAELVESSLSMARGETTDDVDVRIHELRKNLKKARGALRVVRGATDSYHVENHRYRDTGRRLSELRDAKALEETLAKHDERLREAVGEEPTEALSELVARNRAATFERYAVDEQLELVAQELALGLEGLGDLAIDAEEFDALADGMAKTYRRARRTWSVAYDKNTFEAFHAWRKRTKYHRYHVELVCPAWPGLLGEHAGQLARLTDVQGWDHDLAVVDALMAAAESRIEGREVLRAELMKISAELRATASDLARRVFAEDEDALVARMRAYWEAWRRSD